MRGLKQMIHAERFIYYKVQQSWHKINRRWQNQNQMRSSGFSCTTLPCFQLRIIHFQTCVMLNPIYIHTPCFHSHSWGLSLAFQVQFFSDFTQIKCRWCPVFFFRTSCVFFPWLGFIKNKSYPLCPFSQKKTNREKKSDWLGFLLKKHLTMKKIRVVRKKLYVSIKTERAFLWSWFACCIQKSYKNTPFLQ